MKNLSFVICLLIIPFLTFAQDHMWYVKDGRPIDLMSAATYGPPISNLSSFDIKNVYHPNVNINQPTNNAARNDFFIIYKDGTHFNSKSISRFDWHDVDFSLSPPPFKQNYSINTDGIVEYFYFTNVYEGNEEPMARITPNSSPSAGAFFNVHTTGSNSLGFSNPPLISANNTLAKGKNITIILSQKKDQEGECTYNLCFDKFHDANGNIINGSSFILVEDKVFKGGTEYIIQQNRSLNRLSGINLAINNGCINGLNFILGEFIYINLKVPDSIDPSLIGDSLKFRLISTDPSCKVDSMSSIIMNAHDPNYVEVMCVDYREERDYNYIKYKAFCMNDAIGSVNDPSIEFTFPFPFTIDNFDILNITGHISPNSINQSDVKLVSLNNNRARFNFTGKLHGNTGSTSQSMISASVEFCVRTPKGFNLLDANLEPTNRQTMFGSDVYSIYTYIDPCVEYGERPNNTPIDENKTHIKDKRKNKEVLNYYKLNCLRTSSNCKCEKITATPCKCRAYELYCCGEFRWMYAGLIGLILGLLFVGFRFFRK